MLDAVILAGTLLTRRPQGGQSLDPEPAARYMVTGRILSWWDPVSADNIDAKPTFNVTETIHRDDNVGPEACKKCHTKQCESWSEHPHRWMNAHASESTVLGDFSYRFYMTSDERREPINRIRATLTPSQDKASTKPPAD